MPKSTLLEKMRYYSSSAVELHDGFSRDVVAALPCTVTDVALRSGVSSNVVEAIPDTVVNISLYSGLNSEEQHRYNSLSRIKESRVAGNKRNGEGDSLKDKELEVARILTEVPGIIQFQEKEPISDKKRLKVSRRS